MPLHTKQRRGRGGEKEKEEEAAAVTDTVMVFLINIGRGHCYWERKGGKGKERGMEKCCEREKEREERA